MKYTALSHSVALALSLMLASTAQAENYSVMYPVKGITQKPSVPTLPEGAANASCKNILAHAPASPSGVYTIEPTPGNAFPAYCDMVSEGGGWTLVVAQYEHDPVLNWDEGIQADYDPSLASKKGFALNATQLPAHTQFALGKDLLAADIDYFDYTYSTGNLNLVLLTGRATGLQYHLHRDLNGYQRYHDAEGGYQNFTNEYSNTLTADRTGGRMFTWSFSPKASTLSLKGYGYGGSALYSSSQDFAWTVWVR